MNVYIYIYIYIYIYEFEFGLIQRTTDVAHLEMEPVKLRHMSFYILLFAIL